MKITTEIIHSIFVINCEGPILDASLTKGFMVAMKKTIRENQTDTILDLSAVDFVDSNGLGSVLRSFKEIDDKNQLIVCGVDERSLSLFKNTLGAQRVPVRHETDRNAALGKLFWNDKEEGVLPEENEPLQGFSYGDAVLQENNTAETAQKERRKYRRIEHSKIMNDDFIIYCTNMTTGRHHPAVVLNISSGGLLMEARSQSAIGDQFVIEGRIGRSFKFKERAISRSHLEHKKYGLEFINPSGETTHFLKQLTGSLGMTQSSRPHLQAH